MKWTSIKIPTKLYVRFKALAAGRASTAPRLLALAMEEFLGRNEGATTDVSGSGPVRREPIVPDRVEPAPIPASQPTRRVYDEFNQEREW